MSTLGEYTWQEVEPYLDRALELSGRGREDYVASLAADRPGIAAALTALLADGDELKATGFLENPVVMPADPSLIGQVVGAYTIHSAIGRGGMGEVWLALRSDGRFEGKFAIKLRQLRTSPAALARFRHEGRLLARLSHPHIARLIDAGVTPSGRPYLVLEYVDGQRIDDYCASHSLGIQARVRLLLDARGAHARAWKSGASRRSNPRTCSSALMEPPNCSTSLLKLLIPEADPGAEEASAPTRLEEAALTPEFAAPEQLLGEPATIATDIHQVGVLMFVLLAGRLPMTFVGTTRAERIKAALDGEPLRLSAVAPEERQRELRGDLDAIVSKALRKLPQERYATAAAMADDLERYLNHEPKSARANLLGYRVRKFVRRYRAAVTGTAAAALALIA